METEWLAILTFARLKGAQLFVKWFERDDRISFGVANKVVIFSNSDPAVIHHLVEKAMKDFSLMSYTVNKIRVSGE